jgi:hypothetical protein
MADDDESLDEILSTPIKQPVAEVEAEGEQPSEPVRDEHGRFAPKPGDEDEPEVTEEQPEAEPEAETEEHNAPVAAVIAERRKAQAERERADKLEASIAELRGQISVLTQQRTAPPQPQPEPVKPPDFWDDPSKYVEHALTPFQQQIAQMTYRASRAEALAEYGKETVTAAQAALEQAAKSGQIDGAAVADTLRKSADPVGDIVRWHQNRPEVQQATMRETLRAELMAEFGIDPNKPAQPSTPSPQKPLVKMPPSLSRIPAGHSAPERDESLDEVLSAPRRRA